jgi:hypothetical protein
MSAHDRDVVVAVVAPEAVLHAPVDRAVLKGVEQIREFSPMESARSEHPSCLGEALVSSNFQKRFVAVSM